MERQLDDAFGYARGNAFFWCAKLYPWMMAHFLSIGETHVRAKTGYSIVLHHVKHHY